MKCFFVDDRKDLGTVSFALLGVLIILLSIIAVSYFSRIERIEYENRLQKEKISDLEEGIDKTVDTIKNHVHYLAVQSTFEGYRNENKNISGVFRSKLTNYLEEKRKKGGWRSGSKTITLKKNHHNLTIQEKMMETASVTPQNESGGRYERVRTDKPGEITETNTSFCYQIKGEMLLKVENHDNGMELSRNEVIQMAVDVPFPFLEDKMEYTGKCLKGKNSDMGRMVNYILTTLAQYRTLMGYGMEDCGDLDNSTLRATGDIITKDDVELAVNLAFILEMAYQYRTYDEDSVGKLVNNSDITGSAPLKDIIDNYVEKKSIDPADIMILFYEYGFDGDAIKSEDSLDINITAIIAQAMNALVDQYIMKYFDYFGMTKGINALLKVIQSLDKVMDKLKETGDKFMDFITGDEEDDFEINSAQVDLVKNWVQKTFQYAGLMNTNIVRRRYLMNDTMNGEEISGYPSLPDDFHKEYEFRYKVRLTGKEHEWYEYSCGHGEKHRERGDTCNETIPLLDSNMNIVEGRCGAEEIKVGYDYLIKTVRVNLDGGTILFHSKDITGSNDRIWQKFYNEHYSERGEPEITNIKKMVKEVINTFVSSALDDKVLNGILNDYRKMEVDPTDRRSIFSEIDKQIKGAIGDTIDYYRENPEAVVELVKKYLYDADPKIKHLKELLNESYHSFIGDNYIQKTAERTSDSLLSEENPYVTIEGESSQIIKGGVDDNCDFRKRDIDDANNIPKSNLLDIVKDGGAVTDIKSTYLKENLTGPIEDGLKEIKNREVREFDFNNRSSQKDGLLIQAFDSYQYNTTVMNYEPEKITDTRGNGGSEIQIQNITPDPATIGQDVVHFSSNISVNLTSVEWISNVDGHLSDQAEFNLSTIFLSPGYHSIRLEVIDEQGFTHEDTEEIFINRPPVARFGEISPLPATESEPVKLNSSSYDFDGNITEIYWDLGDGDHSTDRNTSHIYEDPGNYHLTLNVTDDKGGYDVCSKELLVDNAPRIIDIRPMGNDSWETNQSITVEFSESLDNTSLEYDIGGDVTFFQNWTDDDTVVTLIPKDHYNRYTDYDLTIKDVRDIDNGTNSSLYEPVSLLWKTKEYANITGNYPILGDTDIKVQSSVILSFSERVYLNSIERELFSKDRNWSSKFEENHTRVILDHDQFPSNSDVELKLDLTCFRTYSDDSVVTESGRGDTNFSLSFITEDYDPPHIVETDPEEGGGDTPLSEDIRIEFDEKMNISSFDISLCPGVSNLTYNWSDEGDKVTVEHAPFLEDQNYTVFISCEDLDGNSLDSSSVNASVSNPFHFTTVDRNGPSVISISPKNGTEEFLTDAPITILFNDSVDPETLRFTCDPDPGYWSSEWNSDRTQVNLIHAEFDRGASYNFTILDVEDKDGEHLANKTSVRFNTSVKGSSIHGNYLQRLVWSIISKSKIDDSLFSLTEEFLQTTTSNMISSSKMSNLEYRLPMALEEGYGYGQSSERTEKNLELILNRYPKYLDLKENITISKPSGTHYTNLKKISSRPYKTRWEIHVPSIDVDINVSQKSSPIIVEGESKGIWMNESYEVGFDLTVSVASGWKLAGVDYEVSHDILGAIMKFLNKAWKFIKKAVSCILDCIQKITDLFKQLVEKLKDQATKFLKMLGQMMRYVIKDVLGPKVVDLLKNVDPGKLKILDKFLSLMGVGLDIDVSPKGNSTHIPGTQNKHLRFVNLSMGGELFGTSFDININVLESNVIAFGKIKAGRTIVDWQADPLADVIGAEDEGVGVYNAWLQCSGVSGTEEEGVYVNLTVPQRKVPEKEKVISAADYTLIDEAKIPIGPVVVTGVDLGLQLKYRDVGKEKGSLLSGLVMDTFRDTISSMSGTSFSFQYIVKFIKTLIMKFIENVISMVKKFVHELSLFFQAVINGVQVVLSFGIHGGESVSAFMSWFVSKIKDMISSITDKKLPDTSNDFPQSIIDDTYLTIEVGQANITGYFSANLPALAALARKDIGRFCLEFGVDVPKYKLVAGTIEER